MKQVLFALLLLLPIANALSCTYDNNPNLWTDLRLACSTNGSTGSRCYGYVFETSSNLVIAEYPKGTFDYDRENYLVPDTHGGFLVVAPLGGEYQAKVNYTMNVTCFNSTNYDSDTFTFETTIPRTPTFIGEIGEWIVTNGSYLGLGVMLLFFVSLFLYLFLRRR